MIKKIAQTLLAAPAAIHGTLKGVADGSVRLQSPLRKRTPEEQQAHDAEELERLKEQQRFLHRRIEELRQMK